MDLNGLKYHYLDEGSGDPIIMLHGNPTWSFYFRELVKNLSPEYRTVVPDHIGCGLSDKPGIHRYDYRLKSRVNDLDGFLDHLGVKEKITLVVHDWGGMIGMAYAVRYPERLARIVVMNTAAFFPPGGKSIPMRLRMVRNLKPLATFGVLGLNLFAAGALFMASHRGLPKNVKKGLIAPYNCWDNRIATLQFVRDIPVNKTDPSYGMVEHVEKNLHKLDHIPLLICWGEHDFVFDLNYLSEWKRRFPHAQVQSFPDAGHYVLEDAGSRIVSLVKDFLYRHPV
ncbi:MAG: alpha/beta fold hydrolase [Deltaproteobacteria bacterium]|nr:alpha/beta fold hydrolase [Deltaproteobacteria bacterium]MBW2193167.1 alpha/beta fold hydrolase [Deltaproteobacteria bacterium]